MLEKGISAFQAKVLDLFPWLGDRVKEIQSEQDLHLLNVRLNRLKKWYREGFICIGDAAHAMSPVGGIGINLAVSDAVAAARILAPAFHNGRKPSVKYLKAIQKRRVIPTTIIQNLQRIMHKAIFREKSNPHVLNNRSIPKRTIPLPMKIFLRLTWLQYIPVYIFAFGVLPETTPDFAHRKLSHENL